MSTATAPAKLNLALVVGPRRDDGRHELVTVMVPVELADTITLEVADELTVGGFADDTLVRRALEAVAAAARVPPRWHVTIEKEIPVASGLGGGSSDAAAALVLANDTLEQPFPPERLHELAAGLGADVPFFLAPGPKLARGDGTRLERLELRNDFAILLLLPEGASKPSTAAVYDAFDARSGERGFERRVADLEQALEDGDLAALPRNDLAASPYVADLERLGAVRADVTGAGPVVFGLFGDPARAEAAADELAAAGRLWLTKPGW